MLALPAINLADLLSLERLGLEWIPASQWGQYILDLDYADWLVGQYKELIWLVLTLVSTSAILYGLYLPTRNASRQRRHEATLSLIDRWTSQSLPFALSEYQREVSEQPIPLINSEAKSRLYSYFHTVALLIREQKVEESLIRKSQISAGFVCFYNTLLIEQPDLTHKHTYYGREFQKLFRKWRRRATHPHYQDPVFRFEWPTPPSAGAPSANPAAGQSAAADSTSDYSSLAPHS
jgi:hypothetical protein